MQSSCKDDPTKLYFSNNIWDIISFFYCFDDVKELIEWSRSLPNADINIFEKEGDTEIIFIIPTPSINDDLTINLSKSLGNFHIIYSESKGMYFNYAKSVNRAVKEALKYNPKWIIVSNNDIIIKDDIKKLYSQLMDIDNKKNDAVIGAGGSDKFILCKFDKLSNLLFLSSYRHKLNILRRFKADYYIKPNIKLFSLFCRPVLSVKNLAFFGPFLIVSPYYVKKRNGLLFDETYINGGEDTEVFLDVISNGTYDTIHFTIEHLGNYTLGGGNVRSTRNYFNIIYLNYKIKNGLIKISKKNISL